MTYRSMFDDFGSALREAEVVHGRRQRRRVRRGASALAVVTSVACALVLTGIGGGDGPRSAIAEAREALGSAGSIVHFITSTRVEPGDPGVTYTGPAIQRAEQWRTSDPLRWRMSFDYPAESDDTAGRRPGGAESDRFDPLGDIAGPVQVAYADGVQSTYLERRATLTRVHGIAPDHGAARLPAVIELGDDPVATLRGMLDDGKLRDAGEHTTSSGRAVRRLESADHRVLYDVDPASYEPVTVTFRSSDRLVPTTVIEFERFERLQATPENLALLTIDAPASVDRIDRDATTRDDPAVDVPSTK